MRVYLPATLPGLAGLLRKAEIGPAPLRAFAVTPALREWYASGDLDELEYVAMMHAARASLRLLVADPGAPRRRVVLAAEMPEQQVATPRRVRRADPGRGAGAGAAGPGGIRAYRRRVAMADVARAVAALYRGLRR
jgi:hypothetical protein